MKIILNRILFENEDEIQTLVDIISMSPNAPRMERYKNILKQKYNFDYDKHYQDNDENIIKKASLDDIKEKEDFLSFEKYRDYAKKIFNLRGLAKKQPKQLNLDVSINDIKMLGNKLGFDVEHKEYAGFGNYAQASTNKIEMPQTADINTVIHEIGHIFYNLIYKDGIASSLTHASSYYGIGMTGEVFAENFMHYFIAPSFLKMHLPEVYSDLNKRIPDKWKKEIKNLFK